MSRVFIVVPVTAAFLCSVCATALHAQHGHSAKPTVTASHGPAAKPPSPKPVVAKPTSHGPATHGHLNTTRTSPPASHPPKTMSHAPKPTAKTTSHGHKPANSTTARTSSTAPAGTATTTMTPVQQKLARNTNLAAKLQSRLPAGTDLQQAAAGFRNLGQFVAAVNVSHNLDIPFAQLKTDMVTNNMSLGQSIQHLRPAADSTAAVQQAQTQTNTLLTPTSTSTGTAPVKRHKTKAPKNTR